MLAEIDLSGYSGCSGCHGPLSRLEMGTELAIAPREVRECESDVGSRFSRSQCFNAESGSLLSW